MTLDAHSSSSNLKNERYTIPIEDPRFEAQRLDEIHDLFLKTVYDGRLIYDTSINIGAGDTILDVATGSASWLLSFAKEAPKEAKLVGVDISDSTLPKTYPPNVEFRLASVLDLPKEWEASLDFIHQRLLSAALSKDEWATALREHFRVLKPGKSVQLVEVGMLEIENEGPIHARVNDLLTKMYESRGLVIECPLLMSRWLEQAGFTDVVERRVSVPFGRGSGELVVLCRSLMERTLRKMAVAIQQSNLVGSVEEWYELMDSVVKEWEGQGHVSVALYVFCAKKPE